MTIMWTIRFQDKESWIFLTSKPTNIQPEAATETPRTKWQENVKKIKEWAKTYQGHMSKKTSKSNINIQQSRIQSKKK